MFNNLLESKRKSDRSVGGSIASVLVHVAIGVAVVVATANAGQQMVEKARQENLKFVTVKKPPPPPPKPEAPPPPDVVAAPPPPKGFQVVTAPVNIPDKIPEVDLSKAVTNEADFSGVGVAGGKANGVAGGTGPVTDKTYFSFQVEQQTVPLESNPKPAFPEMLRSTGAGGSVMVQFVVDTTGRVQMSTLDVLKSTNELFTREVKRVLSQWRFIPAETGGRKVRQLVQLPFTFALQQ